MTDLVQETRLKFIPQPLDHHTVTKARVGDRMIYMTVCDSDVLEVIMVRKTSVVARALTGNLMEKGSKHTLPAEFTGQWPAPVSNGQVTLHRKPEHADADDGKAVAKVKRVRPAPGESKLAKCKAIYAAHAILGKDELVKKFVEEAGCTPAGAVTYYHACRKG